MARKKNLARKLSRQKQLRPLAGLFAMGVTAPLWAQSQPFPTYQTGPLSGNNFVVSDGQIITPAGIQIELGDRVRAKAIALNPKHGSHTAAVLTLGASEAVQVFDTLTGKVLQTYSPSTANGPDSSGSYSGISYSADGKWLMFSQDSSNVAIASVSSSGLLSDHAQISVPPDNSFIKCFPNSPMGDYGRPCGTFYTTYTSYPGGVAFSQDGNSAYALLNQNNTLAKLDLKTNTQGTQIRVGNAPHSIVVRGGIAYVSNEGGREATQADIQVYSAGTPIVADPVNGSAITGTVSVVNLSNMKVIDTISQGIGLHPTGMAMFGDALLVANTYSDTISVIDTATNRVMRTINLGLPIRVPGQKHHAYGAGPNSIAVDEQAGIAYVALYNANAIAIVDLSGSSDDECVLGMIPVAYAPASVVLDRTDRRLLVANDKGIGTRTFPGETDYGVSGYNSHADNGTVSIVPLPDKKTLHAMTRQVYENNHWDLRVNIESAAGGDRDTAPVPIPAKIGDPSLIKHVFLIIRENRTYDQILGDVSKGDGDPSLTVFGATATPNMHDIIKRFPLLDNFYTPSRQSADGHQWIVEAMAPYADDVQSPDWVRSYPGGNAGDSLAYTKKGFLFQETVAAGLSTKIYGEYVENETYVQTAPSGRQLYWSDFYADSQKFEAGQEPTLTYQNAVAVESSIPVVTQHLIKNFPQFDLNIPDQFRVDLWVQDFNKDLQANTVPALSILWIMDDHTGGPPDSDAEQADNDLAVGRIIDYISHSKVWASSAIFIEEDDSQNGVDHVDGHRSPSYVVSPYAVQHGATDHTYYTQVNMTRTIEQILGLPPMNQFDLVASPMRTCFVERKPGDDAFKPIDHLPNQIPLDKGVTPPPAASLSKMAKAWRLAKLKIFKGKLRKPDAEDPDTVNHLGWYEATDFKRPYPGETKVRPPSDFAALLKTPDADDDD